METTHSIIITYQDTAVVWYPNGRIDFHWLDTRDGTIRPDPYKMELTSLNAVEFVEHYAYGTE